MIPTKYKTNIKENALKGIATGMVIANNVAKRTMGPKGVSVCIEVDLYPFSMDTDDGATAIEYMQFEDPLEKRGLGYMKEGCQRSNDLAKDGSTATCGIMTTAVVEASESSENEIDIRDSIESLYSFVEEKIDEQKKNITVEEVEKVASIAAKSKERGKVLAEIYKVIGKDGIIYPEGSETFDTSYSIIEGIHFKNAGFLSNYMVHDEDARKEKRPETKAIYHNPTILVTKRKISSLGDINPLLLSLDAQGKKDLVILTDDMDSNVATLMVNAHRSGIFNILVIKVPIIYKNSIFEDFAKCTGATIVEDASGIASWKSLPLSALGTCEKLMTDANQTILLGTKDISDHIAVLKTKTDVESQMRLCWLTPKTALLKIGSKSETDLSYKRLKYDDAIGSSQSALQEGIVPGGGIALYNVSMMLPDSIGGRILKKALQTPFMQLCENSRITPELEKIGGEMGYDFKTKEIVNLIDAGIVDSVVTVKNEFRNAIGIASTAITTPFLIAKPEETPEQIAHNMLKGQGLRM